MDKQLSAERDPVGVVHVKGNQVIREIHKEFQTYFLDILKQPVVQKMLGRQLIDTRVAKTSAQGLTLEHPLISPASYAYEWPLPMLQDAALLTLEISQALCEIDTVLKDATPWNILFCGTRPQWVDFTSLMPQDVDLPWVAYDQYCLTFLYPLLVGYFHSGKVARALLLVSQNGIPHEEITHYLPGSAKFKFGWLNNRLYLPKFIVDMARKSGSEKDLVKRSQQAVITSTARKAFFEGLRKDTLSIQFAPNQSEWTKYKEETGSFFEPGQFNPKQSKVAELIEKCEPASVVDIGCQQGGYAILASQQGAQVTAFDTNDKSISLLYKLAREKDLNILPLVGDALLPTPASGWRAQEFPPANQRLQAQMALALDLVHQMAITHIQTFDRIVLTLSEYAEKWLVTEFIPLEDARCQELLLSIRRDLSWYNLDNFLTSLRKEFSSVTTYPSSPSNCTLCFCKR